MVARICTFDSEAKSNVTTRVLLEWKNRLERERECRSMIEGGIGFGSSLNENARPFTRALVRTSQLFVNGHF